MHTGTLCFLIGVFAFQQLPALPDAGLALLLPAAVLGAFRGGWARPIGAAAAGFLYALLRAHALAPSLPPPEWEGRNLVVEGMVIGLPERREERVRFEFDIHRIDAGSGPAPALALPWRVRLNWYRGAPRVDPGDEWRLEIRLKRPHGFSNPGGFDYEGWLFRRGLSATGYVRAGRNERLAAGSWSVARARQRLGEGIDGALGKAPLRPLVKALALGLRDEMSPGQWRVLRSTGTAHLMAISGLHVGLVSGLAFALVSFAWRIAGVSVLLIDARRVAAVAALAAALVYAALAGFTVPTQRAAVMVACLMFALILRRPVAPATLLGRALLAVLILDPFAVNEAGFWLSFSAVGFIFYAVVGRLALCPSRAGKLWWRYGRIQCLLGLALLPLGLRFFAEYPLGAPLANALAVPWVSALVVPPVLAGTLLSSCLPPLGALLLDLGHSALAGLWSVLELLSRHLPMLAAGSAAPRWQMLAALAGVLILLAPRGVPARWLGGLWMAPIFLGGPAPVPENTLRLSVLDVGQGLAVVLRTRAHTLVYDTGPRFSRSFDAGAAVVVPYLHHVGVREIDALVLSHRHQDHVGGAQSVLDGVRVRRFLANAPSWTDHAAPCRAGRRWEWDGAHFEVLHPPEDTGDTGNEGSCVLRVRMGASVLLLTGDIGVRSEAALIRRHALRSDVLLVPHHGSDTSSSPAFLDAVRPRLALASYGYRNRFGLPDPEVMARYRSRGIVVLDTVREGAIEIDMRGDGSLSLPRRHRREAVRYWHATGEGGAPRPGFPSWEAWRVILSALLSGT